jgi:hypothetical protein
MLTDTHALISVQIMAAPVACCRPCTDNHTSMSTGDESLHDPGGPSAVHGVQRHPAPVARGPLPALRRPAQPLLHYHRGAGARAPGPAGPFIISRPVLPGRTRPFGPSRLHMLTQLGWVIRRPRQGSHTMQPTISQPFEWVKGDMSYIDIYIADQLLV